MSPFRPSSIPFSRPRCSSFYHNGLSCNRRKPRSFPFSSFRSTHRDVCRDRGFSGSRSTIFPVLTRALHWHRGRRCNRRRRRSRAQPAEGLTPETRQSRRWRRSAAPSSPSRLCSAPFLSRRRSSAESPVVLPTVCADDRGSGRFRASSSSR